MRKSFLCAICLLPLLQFIAADETAKNLVEEFEKRAKIIHVIEVKNREIARIKKEDIDAWQVAKDEFIQSFNQSFDLSYTWLHNALTASPVDFTESLVYASVETFGFNVQTARRFLTRAQDVLKTAGEMKLSYLKMLGNEGAAQNFEERMKKELQETTEKVEESLDSLKMEWAKHFLSDLNQFVKNNQGASNLAQKVVNHLQQRFPFRVWMAIRFKPEFPQRMAACTECTPSAHIALDVNDNLFVAQTDPDRTPDPFSEVILMRPAASEFSGLYCDRKALDIFHELQYRCGAERPSRSPVFIGVVPKRGHEWASSKANFLLKREVRRWLPMFCYTIYEIIVFG